MNIVHSPKFDSLLIPFNPLQKKKRRIMSCKIFVIFKLKSKKIEPKSNTLSCGNYAEQKSRFIPFHLIECMISP